MANKMSDYKKGDWVIAKERQNFLVPGSINVVEDVEPFDNMDGFILIIKKPAYTKNHLSLYSSIDGKLQSNKRFRSFSSSYFKPMIIRTRAEKLLAKILYG